MILRLVTRIPIGEQSNTGASAKNRCDTSSASHQGPPRISHNSVLANQHLDQTLLLQVERQIAEYEAQARGGHRPGVGNLSLTFDVYFRGVEGLFEICSFIHTYLDTEFMVHEQIGTYPVHENRKENNNDRYI